MICGCFRKSISGDKMDREKRKRSKSLEKQISASIKVGFNKAIIILLLGPGESGKTTILKQMKILHVQGFTNEERKRETKLIRINMLEAIKEIMTSLNEWIPNFSLANKESVDAFNFIQQLKIINIDNDDHFVFGSKYFQSIKTVWLDENVQHFFPDLSGYSILDSAKYYLDKIDEIAQLNYIASDDDIVRSRRKTSEITKLEFNLKVPSIYGGGTQLFWVFDVGGQKGERRKWIQVFEGINAILFLISASEFDMKTREKHKSKVKRRSSRASIRSLTEQRLVQLNRMDDSIALFRDICESRFLEYCGMICFLNKQDQLRDKIVNKRYRMIDYFPDYDQFEYEPKITSLTENGQEYLNNLNSKTKYFKTVLKVNHKMSRQSSENSFNHLEPIGIPENNDDDSINLINSNNLSHLNAKNSYDCSDNSDEQLNKLDKRSFKSLDNYSINDDYTNPKLEFEYRKARCYIKNIFVKVAEESFQKKLRKPSNNFVQIKKPRERECFFKVEINV